MQAENAVPLPLRNVPTLSIAELDVDPHGIVRRHRPLTPFIARETGSYLVIRSHDVEPLIKDPRVRQVKTELGNLFGITEGVLFDFFEQGMLTSNGTIHRRRRSPFVRAFAARLMAELRPQIRKSAENLVESRYHDGEVDLVEQYFALIRAWTIADLLGLPRAGVPHFTRLVYQVSRILSLTFTPDDVPDTEAAARQLPVRAMERPRFECFTATSELEPPQKWRR